MTRVWDEAELQRHIDDGIEEQLQLEYKAAGSLGKQNDKTTELTKDVSAMANSDGGIIIYGIEEKNHLPVRIDAIDRTQFSKEWAEDIIHLIRPKIDKVIITPVTFSSGPDDVSYVIEIPAGTTAHQARDKRYYKRHNFKAEPMEDYEVRLVMNRAITPNVSIRFENRLSKTIGQSHYYILHPIIKNEGNQVVNHIKLVFVSPGRLLHSGQIAASRSSANSMTDSESNYVVSLQTALPLFPEDERNLGLEMEWEYSIFKENLVFLAKREVPETDTTVKWKLYADNMIPKSGTFSYYDFRH